MKTINHKHENAKGIRTNKMHCREIAENINEFHGLRVIFYARYEFNASEKCRVYIPSREEMHIFATQTDAYYFLNRLYIELCEAEAC